MNRRLLATCCAAAWLPTGAAAAAPLLSEVLYDAPGSDDGQSFVELWGAPGTDLAGLALEGVNGSNGSVGPVIALSGLIPADGIFVVADALADGSTAVGGFDLLADFDFQNGPDSIVLTDGTTVFDALGYGSFGAGEIFAGEGSPAPDAPAGSSLARVFADLDTGDNAADFVVLASPTPGMAAVTAPEPGAALLLGAGLAGLAALSRRRRGARPARVA